MTRQDTMRRYVVLLRGVNVGGRNLVPMEKLRTCLAELGFLEVSTYIASGNVILASGQPADAIRAGVEAALARNFRLDSESVKALVLSAGQLEAVVRRKPKGFGEQPGKYHSDVIFMMDGDAADAMAAFDPREGVDTIWLGHGVIYSQRVSSMRTKSRLNKIMAAPVYKSMTIRNWNTTTRLLELVRNRDSRTPA